MKHVTVRFMCLFLTTHSVLVSGQNLQNILGEINYLQDQIEGSTCAYLLTDSTVILYNDEPEDLNTSTLPADASCAELYSCIQTDSDSNLPQKKKPKTRDFSQVGTFKLVHSCIYCKPVTMHAVSQISLELVQVRYKYLSTFCVLTKDFG